MSSRGRALLRPWRGSALVVGGLVALASAGCSRVEKWVSAKADESIAHEIELFTDTLTDGNRYPSGVPVRRRSAPAAPASAPTPVATPTASP